MRRFFRSGVIVILVCTMVSTGWTEGNTGQFHTTGKWKFGFRDTYADGKGSIYSMDPTATATWLLALPSGTKARLFLFVYADTESRQVAEVTVKSGGRDESIMLDYSMGEPGWVELGEFEFRGRPKEGVYFSAGPVGKSSLSALKLEILDRSGEVLETRILDEVAPDFSEELVPASSRRKADESALPPGEWELVLSDDFDSLDSDAWQLYDRETWGRLLSVRLKENVVVEDGILRLITRREEVGGKNWTSGGLRTRTFRQQYGYFEARLRYAPAPGLNNAFWLHPASEGSGFEIDINEGHWPNFVNVTLHQSGEESLTHKHEALHDLSSEFHLSGAEWNESEIIYYLDGEEIHRQEHHAANLPCAVHFSTAVISWAGPLTSRLDSAAMEVDWVRVYDRKSPP